MPSEEVVIEIGTPRYLSCRSLLTQDEVAFAHFIQDVGFGSGDLRTRTSALLHLDSMCAEKMYGPEAVAEARQAAFDIFRDGYGYDLENEGEIPLERFREAFENSEDGEIPSLNAEDDTPPVPEVPASPPPEAVPDDARSIAVSTAPDVCFTPMGSSKPPVPYSVFGIAEDDSRYTPDVFGNSVRFMVLCSQFTKTYGDEPGTGGGVISGTTGDIVEPVEHSSVVRIDGSPLIRHDDACTLNKGNCPGVQIYVEDTDTVAPPDDTGQPKREGYEAFEAGFTTALDEKLERLEGAVDHVVDSIEALVDDPIGYVANVGEAAWDFVEETGTFVYQTGIDLWNDPEDTLRRGADYVEETAKAIAEPWIKHYEEGGVWQAVGYGSLDAAEMGVQFFTRKVSWIFRGKKGAKPGHGQEASPPEKGKPGTGETSTPQETNPGQGKKSDTDEAARVSRDSEKPTKNDPANNERADKGEPVAVARGEYVESWEDFALSATLPITATRYYGHRFGTFGPLGRNRVTPFDETIRYVSENRVDYLCASGTRIAFEGPFDRFKPVRNGTFPDLLLTSETASSFEIRQETVRSIFRKYPDGVFRLSARIDANANRQDFVRTETGLLVELRHSDGFRLAFENDANGLRRSVTWVIGGTRQPLVDYAYDRNGNLTRAVCATGYTITYSYDDRNRLAAWRDASNRSQTRFTYDEADRVIRTETTGAYNNDTFEYDPDQRLTIYRPGGGEAAQRLWFDADQNLIREEDALGNAKTHKYSDAGIKLETTNEEGETVRIRPDKFGRPRRIQDAEGRWALYGWGSNGELTIAVDGEGNAHRFAYDRRCNLTELKDPLGNATRFEWTPSGRLAAIHFPDGTTERRGYDAFHRLTEIAHPNGGRTVYERDVFGRIVRETDPAGRTTVYDYEKSIAGAFFRPSRIIRPDGVTIATTFDLEGMVSSVTDGEGRTWAYRYGAFDYLSAIEYPDGGIVRLEYDVTPRLTALTNARGERWTFERDAAGRIVRETDFSGLTFGYVYDKAGRPLEQHRPDGSRRRFRYDRSGLLIEETCIGPDGETIEDETCYAYDDRGLVLSAHNRAARIDLRRDALGRVVGETQNGRTIERAYDGLGRCASRTVEGRTTRLDHDPLGLVRTLMIDGHAPLHVERDVLGRETARVSEAGFRLSQAWDAVGQLVEQTAGATLSPLKRGLEAAMEAQRRGLRPSAVQTQVQRRYAWNKAFEPVTINDGRWGTSAYGYDTGGRVTSHTAGDGQVERYMYDLAGNRAAQGVGTAPEGGSQGGSHGGHQGAGTGGPPGITGQAGSRLSVVLASAKTAPGGRLERAEGPNGEQVTLRYDALHRVVERRVERRGFRPKVWRYGWDAKDRLIRCITPEDEHWSYAYDPFGRRIAKINETRRSILTGAKPPGRSGTEPDRGAFYEADIRPRVVTLDGTAPAIGTATLWDGDVPAAEAPIGGDGAADWTRATRWYFEDGSFRPLARETPDGKLSYMVTDHLGTPREVFSEDGHLIWAAEYRTWGAVRRMWRRPSTANDDGFGSIGGVAANATSPPGTGGIGVYRSFPTAPGTHTGTTSGNLALADTPQWQEAAMVCPIRFQGQWEDAETGLYYNRFRYYDPLIGQYMTPDPIGLLGGLRSHGYVENPNAWVDPLGLAGGPGNCKADGPDDPTRREAFNEAKRDAGIPTSQQPDSTSNVKYVDRNKETITQNGTTLKTREYTYTRPDGTTVKIQDHHIGHTYGPPGTPGNQPPHFNVRTNDDNENTFPGAKSHYPYRR